MIVTITKSGKLSAQAETTTENNALWDFIQSGKKGVEKPVVQRRRKFTIRKECDQCGKKFSGLRGLGVHKNNVHGVLSMTRAAVYARTHGKNGVPVPMTIR